MAHIVFLHMYKPDMDLHVGTHEEKEGCYLFFNIQMLLQKKKKNRHRDKGNQWPMVAHQSHCAGGIIMNPKPIYQRHDFICK